MVSTERAERVRSVLARAGRLVELHTRGPGPDAETRENLECIGWLAAMHALDAAPETMKLLHRDYVLMLLAAHRIGYLSGVREGRGAGPPVA